MGPVQFFFWETLKVLGLAFLGLVVAKAVGSSRLETRHKLTSPTSGSGGGLAATPKPRTSKLTWIRVALYLALLGLVMLGARGIGNDIAAEIYFLASRDNLAHLQWDKAYSNASRAVALRPGEVQYWRALSAAKFGLHQFQSLVEDRPAFEWLEGKQLDEQDEIRFAYAHFFLAQYDQALALAQQLIKRSRLYGAPYVLEGMTYSAQKHYPEAERAFLEALRLSPTQEEAAEGLAHACFLAGNTTQALSILAQTSKYQFSPEARQRFEDLKALYAQQETASPSQAASRTGQGTDNRPSAIESTHAR